MAMNLKTRIAVFVGLASLLVCAVFAMQVIIGIRIANNSAREDAVTLTRTIWQTFIDDEMERHDDVASRIRTHAGVMNALFQNHPSELVSLITNQGLAAGAGSMRVVILNPSLEPVYFNGDGWLPATFPARMAAIVRPMDTRHYIPMDFGNGQHISLVKTMPIRFRFGIVGYLVIATPLQDVVSQIDQVVDMETRLLPAVPGAGRPHASQGFFVDEILIPLSRDITREYAHDHGPVEAYVAFFDDRTGEMRHNAWLQLTIGTLVVIFVAHVLGGLFRIIRHAFRPLDAAIDVIGRLTRYEEAPPLDTSAGAEEIRHLSEAVEALRAARADQKALGQLQAELTVASGLQQALLPGGPLQQDNVLLMGQMIPSQDVAGDYFDYFVIDEDRVGFLIADVCGKGLTASLFMAMSKTAMRSLAITGRPPGDVLAEANEVLTNDNIYNMFVTLFYGILNHKEGTLVYANAGHVPPIMKLADGSVSLLPSSDDLVLGMVPDQDYETHVIDVPPGSVIVSYTDGIPEAFNASGEQFGDDRLLQLVRESQSHEPEILLKEVRDVVLTFSEGRQLYDDITLCLARLDGPKTPAGAT